MESEIRTDKAGYPYRAPADLLPESTSDTLSDLLSRLEMAEIDWARFQDAHPQPTYDEKRRIDDMNLLVNNARSALCSALERYYRDGKLVEIMSSAPLRDEDAVIMNAPIIEKPGHKLTYGFDPGNRGTLYYCSCGVIRTSALDIVAHLESV
jgi:hypothetical protein